MSSCLLSPAAEDKTPATMEAKKLQEMSGKTTGGHPGVLLLFPGKGAATTPKLEKEARKSLDPAVSAECQGGRQKSHAAGRSDAHRRVVFGVSQWSRAKSHQERLLALGSWLSVDHDSRGGCVPGTQA